MYRKKLTVLVLALCVCAFCLDSVAAAQSTSVPDSAAMAEMLAKVKARAMAAGGAVEVDTPNEEDAEEKESPEDALVAKLVEVKFERTPETILKVWSEKHRKQNEQKKKPETKAKPIVEHRATVVSRFGEVLVLKVASVDDLKKDKKLKAEAAVTIVTQASSDEKLTATVISIDADNVVLKVAKKGADPLKKNDKAKEPSMTVSPMPSDAVVLTVSVESDNKAEAKKEAAAVGKQVEAFTNNVVLADWVAVKSALEDMKVANAEKVYAHLLQSLAASEQKFPEGLSKQMIQRLTRMSRNETPPQSFLTPADILQLTEISPRPIQIVIKGKEDKKDEEDNADPDVEETEGKSDAGKSDAGKSDTGKEEVAQTEEDVEGIDHIPSIATLISIARGNGHSFAGVFEKMKAGTRHFAMDDRIKRLTAADLLLQSQMIEEAESFLPDWKEEATESDVPAMKLWSSIALARFQEKGVALWLKNAWKINQTILLTEDLDDEDRALAINNLINLSPKIDKEIGEKWLDESFTQSTSRGIEILKNLGSQSATYAQKPESYGEDARFKLLTLQNEAVERLIELAPDKLEPWTPALTLLASNWLTEAQTSLQYSTERGGNTYMDIDMYGNYYWVDEARYNRRWSERAQPNPISFGNMLQIIPSAKWQSEISESLTAKMKTVIAEMKIKANRADEAFPEIEAIAVDDPEQGERLVEQFLRTWISNHDPNTETRRRNPYIYSYGFDQKADAIPLTRSKQQRNLEDLSKWVGRIGKMEGVEVEEDLLSQAFQTCHSSAEVFQFEAVKKVFGDLKDLKPETIAQLCNSMRTSLSGKWRSVKEQEKKQTKRKLPEIIQEVVDGYETGLKLADDALVGAPDSWELNLAKACLMYEQNAYSQSIQKRSDFSDRRDAAFAQFKLAADKYADAVRSLEKKDQSTDVYDYWFYAALGACDLGKVSDKTVPDTRQYTEVKKSLESLGGILADDHLSKVANNLFTRMSPIKPEFKFRYLRGGFEIIGDHPRAWEAKALFDYYQDLVGEIKLELVVDGDSSVGHDQPFGAYINLLHTQEIEREAGGFTKYVQNQNSGWYAYNYGRPTENYRDKFNDVVDIALEKHFEVVSVTFKSPDSMESRPADQPGWRSTPFAYVLLKAKGAEVDRIAPLKIDMDFLDTSGYVVIPVESPAVVIDASGEGDIDRPVSDLVITQTLDERMADEGKIVVEVSATAKGLVPPLEQIVKLDQKNFEVVNIDDQGVLASTFDEDSKTPQILSERSWSVEYRAVDGLGESADFSFGEPKMANVTANYQRYEDADLVDVEPKVTLVRKYGTSSWWSLVWVIPLLLLAIGGGVLAWFMRSKTEPTETRRFEVPQEINPFTVLTVLRDIKQRNGIDDKKAEELSHWINRVEAYYFGRSEQEIASEDLKALAERWVQQSN